MSAPHSHPVAGPSRANDKYAPLDEPTRVSSQMPKDSHLHRILKEEKARDSHKRRAQSPETAPSDSPSSSSPSSGDSDNDWSSPSPEPSEPGSELSDDESASTSG